MEIKKFIESQETFSEEKLRFLFCLINPYQMPYLGRTSNIEKPPDFDVWYEEYKKDEKLQEEFLRQVEIMRESTAKMLATEVTKLEKDLQLDFKDISTVVLPGRSAILFEFILRDLFYKITGGTDTKFFYFPSTREDISSEHFSLYKETREFYKEDLVENFLKPGLKKERNSVLVWDTFTVNGDTFAQTALFLGLVDKRILERLKVLYTAVQRGTKADFSPAVARQMELYKKVGFDERQVQESVTSLGPSFFGKDQLVDDERQRSFLVKGNPNNSFWTHGNEAILRNVFGIEGEMAKKTGGPFIFKSEILLPPVIDLMKRESKEIAERSYKLVESERKRN